MHSGKEGVWAEAVVWGPEVIVSARTVDTEYLMNEASHALKSNAPNVVTT